MQTYREDIEREIAEIEKNIAPLKNGRMTHQEKIGDEPWRDITQETIARNERVISTYRAILKKLDLGEPL